MDRFSKFLHQLMRKKILYVHITKNFLQYVATLPCKSRKSNNVTDLDSILSSTTVDMFLRTLWRLDLTFNSGETDCLKTANTDWLTFWRLESTAKQFILKMTPFDDRPYTTFYWSTIVNIALSCTIFELFNGE